MTLEAILELYRNARLSGSDTVLELALQEADRNRLVALAHKPKPKPEHGK